MQHRGEIVKKAIFDGGHKLTWIAKKLKVTRKAVHDWVTNPDLTYDRIIEIGKLIKHDFSNEFVELRTDLVTGEPEEIYNSIDALRKELILTQSENIKLRKQVDKLKDQLADKK